jgi:hypothetical protein
MTPSFGLSRRELRAMLRTVRILYRLSQHAGYRATVAGEFPDPVVTATAQGAALPDGVFMGYDFHTVTGGSGLPQLPQLIEVNTNAGGTYMAWQAWQAAQTEPPAVPPLRVMARLRRMFAGEWGRFCGSEPRLPPCVVIMDDDPPRQHLYPEMCIIAQQLRQWGVSAGVVDPSELDMQETGVFWHGQPVGMIYNRHVDFYLESPALAGVRAAWLAGRVCLTPHPYVYGLLADKRRMTGWSDAGWLADLTDLGVPAEWCAHLLATVPVTRLLSGLDPEQVWRDRRLLVFKPVTGCGSRGVVLGKGVSRARFSSFEPDRTLVQQWIPPATMGGGEAARKVDVRLFVWRDRLLGIAARAWRGQVTNLQEGSGFVPVFLIP